MSDVIDDPIDFECCTLDQREVLLDRLHEHGNATHAELLRAVAAADRLGDWKVDAMHSMADWLGYRYKLAPVTARQWVRAAHALEEMPLLRAEYVAGTVSFEQLNFALTFAKPTDDAFLAGLLPGLSCNEIEVMARNRRRISANEGADARGRTALRFKAARDGLGKFLSGYLTNEHAATVQVELGRRADQMRPDTEAALWRPFDERMADALHDICAENLATAADGKPDATVVVIHAPADLLNDHDNDNDNDSDGDSDGDADSYAGNATINGDLIERDALLRILCETRIEFSIDEPDGRTVGIGRQSQTPPRWLRRRVIARDHGCCRWPGCTRPIRHLHHMVHWTKDGDTNASNLIGVCWHHHHMLHEGAWNATGNADTDVTFTGPAPARRVIHSRAGPIAA